MDYNFEPETIIAFLIIALVSMFIILVKIVNETNYGLRNLECACVKMNYGKWVTGEDNKPEFQLITNNVSTNN